MWLALSQDGQGRKFCTTAAELANLLQQVALLLHRDRGLAHKHLKDLGRKLLCRPAILRVTSSPTADAEILNTLSIVIAVGPRGDNDLRDTGTVVLLKLSVSNCNTLGSVEEKNLHDSLVVSVCSAMMNRADDRTGSKYSKRVGMDPFFDANPVLLKCLAEDLLNSASWQKHRVGAVLFELPEDLQTTLFDLLIKLVDNRLQGLRQLYSLVLSHLDDGAHVDEDGSPLCEPLGQVRLGDPDRDRMANDGATGNNMSWNLEREVQLRKRGH